MGTPRNILVDGAGGVDFPQKGNTATGAAYVEITAGGAGGTQYTEGDTDATITGTAIVFESNTGTNALSTVNDTTPLPVKISSSALNSAAISVSLTRTNDTNIYAAGDVIGSATGSTAALTFAGLGTASTVIRITNAKLEIDVNAVPSGMTSFRLHLYNVTPPSALGDNAVWDLPSGDRASYLGYVDLGTPVDVGSTLYVQSSGLDFDFKMGSTTSLFGYLVTNGGYTPAASTVFVITLTAIPL